MTTIEVREATSSDSKRMAEIHVAAWRAAYTDIMSSEFLSSLRVAERETQWKNALNSANRGKYLVGVEVGLVQGFCVLGPSRDKHSDKTTGELIALNVDPNCRGEGIGTALVAESLQLLAEDGFRYASLWVVKGNDRAISLYERYGFSWSGAQKVDTAHSGNPITELQFSKRLVQRTLN